VSERTLVLTAYAPSTDTGRGLRTYGVVAALARLGSVEVAFRPFGADQPDDAFRAIPNVRYTTLRGGRGARRFMTFAEARRHSVPKGFARGVTPSMSAKAAVAALDVRIVADGPTVAAALLRLAGRRPVHYLAHNLESSFRDDPDLPPRQTARFERHVFAVMAESWMVSAADLAGARELAPEARLRLVPNAVDVTATPHLRPAGQRRILFAADHTYGPNAEARAFLVADVMPRVWRALPDARLAIAGRGDVPLAGDRRIERLGFVEDLEALYASCDAVAVPLLHGGGSPLKFVEAMAHGLPVVATGHAARGLEVVEGEHYLRGDDASAFAAALVRALTGEAAPLAAAGRALAERSYSVEALVRALG
jgi:glycosyltransferase involved in cell wall biosynthesis